MERDFFVETMSVIFIGVDRNIWVIIWEIKVCRRRKAKIWKTGDKIRMKKPDARNEWRNSYGKVSWKQWKQKKGKQERQCGYGKKRPAFIAVSCLRFDLFGLIDSEDRRVFSEWKGPASVFWDLSGPGLLYVPADYPYRTGHASLLRGGSFDHPDTVVSDRRNRQPA